MLFNSYIFVLAFLPICLFGYFLLNKINFTAGNIFLLIMSLFFYGYITPKYIPVITVSIICNYFLSLLISKPKSATKRKAILIIGIVFNLALLGYFKYTDFFIKNINTVFRSNLSFLKIALPLGISFFTFQQISYLVDTYTGAAKKYPFVSYACYVCFFPQLVAGPIVSHDEFFPQFLNPENRKANFNNIGMGIYLFSLGLSKKVLLADILGKTVDLAYGEYGNIPSMNSLTAIYVIFAYAAQLYFDFSGYSDMAIGIGKMFNICLPVNFDSPYKASSINDFWKRWHLTLTRFFTKYVYIPLGGSRRGKGRTYLNIMIVFFLSGLWHGADWTFVFWGVCHGAFSVFERVCKKFVDIIPKWLGKILTFITVSVLWVFFRSNDFNQAFSLIKQVFKGGLGLLPSDYTECFMIPEIAFVFYGRSIESLVPPFFMVAFLIIAFIVLFILKNNEKNYEVKQFTLSKAILSAFLLAWCVYSFQSISAFLYFNF